MRINGEPVRQAQRIEPGALFLALRIVDDVAEQKGKELVVVP